jgi:CHAT domain-containing protein
MVGKGREVLERASWVPAELSADQRWLEITAQLAQLGRESAELARKAKLGLSAAEELRRAQVDADLVLANQRFDRFLGELSREFVAAGARRAEELGARQLRNLVVMQDVLSELGREAVLLHYVVAQNRIAIIVTTADVQIARETRIDAADLNRKVLEFRQALAARRDVTEQARELYRLLIGPVAEDLRQSGARTLMLSLDGTLRYLPFAALNDGRRWLAESYALSIYTEAARTQLARQPQREWTMTGLGLTHAVPGFAALPAVREELEGIRRNGMRGDVFLDEQFTADRLREVLAGSKPVMHIASHFQFKAGTYANSFLVLGNGQRLTLQEIRDRRMRFSSVELLTLSACDTAMGGGVDETGPRSRASAPWRSSKGLGRCLPRCGPWPMAAPRGSCSWSTAAARPIARSPRPKRFAKRSSAFCAALPLLAASSTPGSRTRLLGRLCPDGKFSLAAPDNPALVCRRGMRRSERASF